VSASNHQISLFKQSTVENCHVLGDIKMGGRNKLNAYTKLQLRAVNSLKTEEFKF